MFFFFFLIKQTLRGWPSPLGPPPVAHALSEKKQHYTIIFHTHRVWFWFSWLITPGPTACCLKSGFRINKNTQGRGGNRTRKLLN